MSQVIEFIKFLDAHDGSLLVIITFVYTVATIAICLANIISANAARAQLAEMKQQYEKEDRPHITYEMIFENRTFYGIRFTNHGRRVANHVQIKFSQDFLDSVSRIPTFGRLNTLQKQEFVLGIGRSYDYFLVQKNFAIIQIKSRSPVRLFIRMNGNKMDRNFIGSPFKSIGRIMPRFIRSIVPLMTSLMK